MRKTLSVILLLILTFAFNTTCGKEKKEYRIAWSHYTGWEPWEYADNAGILKKWGDKYNIVIKLDRINDYIESINLFTAGKYQGCAMTNMDALTIPAAGGVDCTALITGDYSNGNDGIVTMGEKTVKDLKGKKVLLVQLSVSHYLLSRALEMNGMQEKDLTLVNTSDAEIGSIFKTQKGVIAVTWNPILMNAVKTPGANLIFDSSKIPGEIIDLMVVNTNAPDELKKALTGAWFETMQVMQDKAKSAAAVDFMAKNSGASADEFIAQLKTTAMFYKAADAVAFTKDAKVKKTMEYVRSFSFDKGLFGQSVTTKDYVGVEFPDGSVTGNKTNVKLRFDVKYMQMAADNKL
jgi:NitT/TauT family transport system substrate-binding protein